MTFTEKQVQAFRYWIQGYQNFYEPIIAKYFEIVEGFEIRKHPAVVGKADIENIISALNCGSFVPENVDEKEKIIQILQNRSRLQPDLLITKDGKNYLVEIKSWGGFGSGKFDLSMLDTHFISNPSRLLFLVTIGASTQSNRI